MCVFSSVCAFSSVCVFLSPPPIANMVYACCPSLFVCTDLHQIYGCISIARTIQSSMDNVWYHESLMVPRAHGLRRGFLDDVAQCLPMQLSFNGAADWQELTPPERFTFPECSTCQPGDDCKLHLHGPSSWHYGAGVPPPPPSRMRARVRPRLQCQGSKTLQCPCVSSSIRADPMPQPSHLGLS